MTYALIQWGGLVPGNRPRTALAYVFDSPSGRLMAYVIDTRSGKSKYKHPRKLDAEDILHQFGRDLPDSATIKTAKLALPIVLKDDPRFLA